MRFESRWVALGLFLSSAGLLQGAEVVDRIVAVVDRHAITLSEAEQAMEFRTLRGGETPELPIVVERLIESYLIEREVRRYPLEPVTSDEVRRAVAALRETFASEEDFRETMASRGMTEASLERLLRSQMTVARYLDRRFRPLVYVTEEEVQDYFEEEIVTELREAGEPVPNKDSVAESIRRILIERKFNTRVDVWIESLKTRTRIRRYVW